jgi:CheY-like chemotaxis protein
MPRKLLLADDSVTIQRVIELTFADEDIQVVAVGDGQQAIARIDAEQPDVVLADIGMPERDGYEVAAHVKGNPQTAHIPVLLLTGAFEPVDEARARAVGCDGVLVKPFEPQMVINRVKDLLAGRRPDSLWSTPPGPTGPVVTPQAAETTPPGPTAAHMQGGTQPGGESAHLPGGDSLDEYFDRLDAAFSEGEPARSSQPEMPPAATPKLEPAEQESEFGSWDIPMERPRSAAPSTSSAGPAPHAAPIRIAPRAESERPGGEAPTIAPESSPIAQVPELADAFAALLAAEQQFGAAPATPAPSAPASPTPIDDAVIDAAVRRVLARMTDETVRAIVLDVAERLVRAEIDKIKSQAKL